MITRLPDVPNILKRYLKDPRKYVGCRQFNVTADFKEYIADTLHNNGTVVTSAQWMSHYATVIASGLSIQRKLDLLMVGGFPHKHKQARLIHSLSQKRINFFKAVTEMVRPSD